MRLEKPCRLCGRKFGLKIYKGGDLETTASFKRRSFCSRICSSVSRERVKADKRDRAEFAVIA